MKRIYELKLMGDLIGYYASIDKACRRMASTITHAENVPFHLWVKQAIKKDGAFKSGSFELTQHELN